MLYTQVGSQALANRPVHELATCQPTAARWYLQRGHCFGVRHARHAAVVDRKEAIPNHQTTISVGCATFNDSRHEDARVFVLRQVSQPEKGKKKRKRCCSCPWEGRKIATALTSTGESVPPAMLKPRPWLSLSNSI